MLADVIEGQGNLKVVLDLHDVSGIDGPSVEAFAAAVEAATQLGGDVTFAGTTSAQAQEAYDALLSSAE